MSHLFNLAFVSYILFSNPTATGLVIVVAWIAFMVVTTIVSKGDLERVYDRPRKTNQ